MAIVMVRPEASPIAPGPAGAVVLHRRRTAFLHARTISIRRSPGQRRPGDGIPRRLESDRRGANP